MCLGSLGGFNPSHFTVTEEAFSSHSVTATNATQTGMWVESNEFEKGENKMSG